MGLSVEQAAMEAYYKLVELNYIHELSDDELDKLIFAAQNERIERAITRGEYKPEEE